MPSKEVLHALEAAATQIAQRCRGVAQELQQLRQTKDRRSEAELCQAAQAVEALRQALDALLPQPPAINIPPSSSLAGRPAIHLLALDATVLARITRAAGKGVRLACKQLAAAYGPPAGSTLCEPPQGTELHQVESASGGPSFSLDGSYQRRLQQDVLAKLMPEPPPLLTVAARCAATWPGRFSALRLSSCRQTTRELLWDVWRVLPGLRELECSWVKDEQPDSPGWFVLDSDDEAEAEFSPLPELSCLTALTLLSTTKDAATNAAPTSMLFQTVQFRTLEVAPALRSLDADLRFRSLNGFAEALQRCWHLTHLAVAFDQLVAEDSGQRLMAQGALAIVAARLRSLEFKTPAAWLGNGPKVLLPHMVQLTNLVWCHDDGTRFGAELPLWKLTPKLQRLVLGHQRSTWTVCNPLALDALQRSFAGTTCAALTTLHLPLVRYHASSYAATNTAPVVQQLLRAVAKACPALARLELGCHTEADAAYDQRPVHKDLTPAKSWVAPLATMRCLQRLAVVIDQDEVGALALLAKLPALEVLWLHLREADPSRTGPPTHEQFPIHALARVTTLRDVTFTFCRGRTYCDGVPAMILAAARRLPCLEVLAFETLIELTQQDFMFRELVAAPPPRLRYILVSGSGKSKWGPEHHQRVLALLRAGLPGVEVLEYPWHRDAFPLDRHHAQVPWSNRTT